MRRSTAERFNVNHAPDPNARSRTDNLTVGAAADWRLSLPLGPGALALCAGVDAVANRVRARIYADPTVPPEGDGAGAVDVADDEPTGLTTDVKSPSVDVAGYALANFRVGRVTLSGGGRWDFVRVPFRNQVRPDDNTTNDYRSSPTTR